MNVEGKKSYITIERQRFKYVKYDAVTVFSDFDGLYFSPLLSGLIRISLDVVVSFQ